MRKYHQNRRTDETDQVPLDKNHDEALHLRSPKQLLAGWSTAMQRVIEALFMVLNFVLAMVWPTLSLTHNLSDRLIAGCLTGLVEWLSHGKLVECGM